MPRIHRRSSSLEPHSLVLENGHLIGVSDADPVELLEIAKASYTEPDFARLSYSVSKIRLRTYVDEFFSSIIETLPVESDDSTGSSSETALTNEQPVRCLVVDNDDLGTRLATIQEYKFVTGTAPFAGVGVYVIYSKDNLGDKSKQLALEKVAQNLDLSTYLMVAIVQPDQSWQIALGYLNVHSPKSMYKFSNVRYASVSFALFDPVSLISSIITGKTLKDVQHVSLHSLIPLTRDLSFYK
ncbi:hypothetical protein [Paenibacillus piri]|uniref:Uncharacterized protein n=1 Tax=Paenibacillus piri TaxID=2547395 RepID=A0A4R5KZW9_9BACL|nr:hypothetical protein [Paenibacillus piri]TDG00879.1 hypothetical protein E1757_04515 [Paenibacillus piri]